MGRGHVLALTWAPTSPEYTVCELAGMGFLE